tara:strand:- start:416 stop:559 length:144 start_codon:yes stop_codon:yes gene_type:complete
MRTKAIAMPGFRGLEELFSVYTIIGTNLALDLVRKILSDAAGAVIGK